MSLVICKNINNKIFIESDSRITVINAAREESFYGILKTIIFHPKISFSFAGNIYLAEKAIKEIFLQFATYRQLSRKYFIHVTPDIYFTNFVLRPFYFDFYRICNSTEK